MNANRRKLFLSTLFLVAAATLFGSACGPSFTDEVGGLDFSHSGIVLGTISDAESGAPLAGAVVSAEGKFAVTDEQGGYRLDELEMKWLEVTAAHESYETVVRGVSVSFGSRADFALVRSR